MHKIKAVIFDLDYTLHDNDAYWFGVFKEVASFLEYKKKLDFDKTYEILMKIFKEKGPSYGSLFKDLFEEINLEVDDGAIHELVKIYHNHEPSLKLYPETVSVLRRLKEKYKIGLISNGQEQTQMKKLKALAIEGYFDTVVFPERSKRKPNIEPFITVAKNLKIELNEIVYVGDNPLEDFESLRKSNSLCIRVLRGPFKALTVQEGLDAQYKIENLEQIFGIIENDNTI